MNPEFAGSHPAFLMRTQNGWDRIVRSMGVLAKALVKQVGRPHLMELGQRRMPIHTNDALSRIDYLHAIHNGRTFRTPTELSVNPTSLKRVLVVGSCFAEILAQKMARTSGIPHDYAMFHAVGDLENSVTRPASDYDCQVVSLALRFLIPESAFNKLNPSDEASCQQLFLEAEERLLQWLDGALTYCRDNSLLTFVCDYFVPPHNPMGRLLRKHSYSNISYFIQKLNETIEREVFKNRNCYVLHVDDVAQSMGKRFVQDEYIWLYNHGAPICDWDAGIDTERLAPTPPVSAHYDVKPNDFYEAVWSELENSIRIARQDDAVKIVIVDLDDTMWRGIIGENGLHAVPIEGWPIAFAEALLYLKRRGIILAIASKNDQSVVEAQWPSIFGHLISLDDFACRRINWQPKALNIGEILGEVNLLPKNALFIDDNPVERASVQSAHPGIRVLGSHPYYLKSVLISSSETQVPYISSESASRTEMIQAQIERENSRQRMTREEFLRSLGVSMVALDASNVDSDHFPRAFELLNKTNQFNTTGRRWSMEEISEFFSGGGSMYAFEAADKFTRYGIISVLLVLNDTIVQQVMSCRVIGMEIERAAISYVEQQIGDSGYDKIMAHFQETPSNSLCRSLYASTGYEEHDGQWVKTIENRLDIPSHISA